MPSGVSYYKFTYLADREFIHIQRGGGWYLSHLHTLQLYIHILLQIQVGACCMVFHITNYHPNAISNSLKKCSLDLLWSRTVWATAFIPEGRNPLATIHIFSSKALASTKLRLPSCTIPLGIYMYLRLSA